MFDQIGTNCGVQIQAAFRTDEIRRSPPTPQDEMRAGMSYFHETIWNGLPKFLRRIDTALRSIGITERLPYNIPLVQFSSWMGGDRDGQFFFATQNDGLSCILAFDSRNSKAIPDLDIPVHHFFIILTHEIFFTAVSFCAHQAFLYCSLLSLGLLGVIIISVFFMGCS